MSTACHVFFWFTAISFALAIAGYFLASCL